MSKRKIYTKHSVSKKVRSKSKKTFSKTQKKRSKVYSKPKKAPSKPKKKRSKSKKSKIDKQKLKDSKKKKRLSKIMKNKMSVDTCKRKKIGIVLHEFKIKKLRIPSGKLVTNPRQAIAIALNSARRACE